VKPDLGPTFMTRSIGDRCCRASDGVLRVASRYDAGRPSPQISRLSLSRPFDLAIGFPQSRVLPLSDTKVLGTANTTTGGLETPETPLREFALPLGVAVASQSCPAKGHDGEDHAEHRLAEPTDIPNGCPPSRRDTPRLNTIRLHGRAVAGAAG